MATRKRHAAARAQTSLAAMEGKGEYNTGRNRLIAPKGDYGCRGAFREERLRLGLTEIDDSSDSENENMGSLME